MQESGLTESEHLLMAVQNTAKQEMKGRAENTSKPKLVKVKYNNMGSIYGIRLDQ